LGKEIVSERWNEGNRFVREREKLVHHTESKLEQKKEHIKRDTLSNQKDSKDYVTKYTFYQRKI